MLADHGVENPSNRADKPLPNISLVTCWTGVEEPLNISLKQFASDSLLVLSLQRIDYTGLRTSEVRAIITVNHSRRTSSCDKSCNCIDKAVGRQATCKLDMDSSVPQAGKNATIALVKFRDLSH